MPAATIADLIKCFECGDTGEVKIIGDFANPCGSCGGVEPVDALFVSGPTPWETEWTTGADAIEALLHAAIRDERTVEVLTHIERTGSPITRISGTVLLESHSCDDDIPFFVGGWWCGPRSNGYPITAVRFIT